MKEGRSDIEIRTDTYGCVPLMCGFASHYREGNTLRVPGHQGTFHDEQIEDISTTTTPRPHKGTLILSQHPATVKIDLTSGGHPFNYNGTYHYKRLAQP